jgi:hypothetical protein
MRVEQAFEQAEVYMEKVRVYPGFEIIAQKFLQEHDGEDSQEMLAQDLGRLLSIAWEAGKIIQNSPGPSGAME